MSIKKIDISKIIGEAVKTARKNKGLTLKALAELVGTSAGHLSEIENNKTTPGANILFSLERTLEINIVAETSPEYNVTQVIQGVSPEEMELLRIARESPEAAAVLRMMGAVDSDTQADIRHDAEKTKRTYDLIKELQDKKAV